MTPLLETSGLSICRGGRTLITALDLALAPGEIIAVVGPNGAGKSSLLAALAGLLEPRRGEIRIEGLHLAELPRRQLARRLGFLPQETEDLYPASVLETVLIGRHPHIGFWSWESANDLSRARSALRHTGLSELSTRLVSTLSGGERRRLAIATVLAQAPRIYILDEPFEPLDLGHQARLFRLLSRLAQRQGCGILLSLHDLSLAARHAGRILLLDGHSEAVLGRADQILTSARLSYAYGCNIEMLECAGNRFFLAR